MKDECCHQHPDNGSELAVQTQAQAEETDLRGTNAALLEALETLAEHASETYPHFESPRGQADMDRARAAIKAAKGDA